GEIHWSIGVFLQELDDSFEVIELKFFEMNAAVLNPRQQTRLTSHTEVEQGHRLRDTCHRRQESQSRVAKECDRGRVIGIISVEQSDDWPAVDEDSRRGNLHEFSPARVPWRGSTDRRIRSRSNRTDLFPLP